MDKFRKFAKKTQNAIKATKRRKSKSSKSSGSDEDSIKSDGNTKSPRPVKPSSAASSSSRNSRRLSTKSKTFASGSDSDNDSKGSNNNNNKKIRKKSSVKENSSNAQIDIGQLRSKLVKDPNNALLNQLNEVVPLLNKKEFKSLRPKMILETLNSKAQSFIEETSCVRIQRVFRGFTGRKRFTKERLIRNIKLNLSSKMSSLLCDEIVVSQIILVSQELLGVSLSLDEQRKRDEDELLAAAMNVMSEGISELVPNIVKSCIKDATEEYLESRRKPAMKNPLLRLVYEMAEESAEEMTASIASEAIADEVNVVLLERRCERALDGLYLEFIVDEIPSLISLSLAEADEEIARDDVISDVMQELLLEDTSALINDMQVETEAAVAKEDKGIIGIIFQELFAKRMVLGHMMMSIANRFDTVLLEHHSRCVVRRLIANRLLTLIGEADTAVNGLVSTSSRTTRDIYTTASAHQIQHLLVNSMITHSLQQMNALDERELAMRAYHEQLSVVSMDEVRDLNAHQTIEHIIDKNT